jgi:hypothetical protein
MNEKQFRTKEQDVETMAAWRRHLARELNLSERQICQNGLDNPLMSDDARRCLANDLIRTASIRNTRRVGHPSEKLAVA